MPWKQDYTISDERLLRLTSGKEPELVRTTIGGNGNAVRSHAR
jgi:hypothetical protein